jgi:FtsH ternary system domain X1
MSAQTTAQRVLAWAVAPDGPPPVGALWEAGQLAAPDPATIALAGELTRVTGARLGAGVPPFADQDAVGVGVVLLAAAAGGRGQPDLAQRLALALPPARPIRARPAEARWCDLVARHGLVAAVLAKLPPASRSSEPAGEPIGETLLGASPLTAVLHRPVLRRLAAGTTGDEVEAAAALVRRPRGHAVLSAALSAWNSDPAVLGWRVELLDRLAAEHGDLVLDTYTLARLRHGADWDERLSWARRTLSGSGPPDPLAVATVRFWVPLARLRQRGTALADVRPLLTGYRHALQLVGYYRLLTTGAA